MHILSKKVQRISRLRKCTCLYGRRWVQSIFTWFRYWRGGYLRQRRDNKETFKKGTDYGNNKYENSGTLISSALFSYKANYELIIWTWDLQTYCSDREPKSHLLIEASVIKLKIQIPSSEWCALKRRLITNLCVVSICQCPGVACRDLNIFLIHRSVCEQ